MKWLQIHIMVEQAQVDFTETLLSSLGAVSVTLDDAENQDLLEPLPGETPLWNKVIVTGIYAQEEGEEIDVAALETFIRAQMPDAPIRHELIEDQAWERTWMDAYEPIQIADKYWIVPEWMEAPDAEAVNIKLDPGLAFGTGNHASTFLCLQWLGKIDVKDKIAVAVPILAKYSTKFERSLKMANMNRMVRKPIESKRMGLLTVIDRFGNLARSSIPMITGIKVIKNTCTIFSAGKVTFES